MDYLKIINNLIIEKKITKRELSQKIEKNENTVQNYLTGKTKIEVETLIKIAEVLKVEISYFFGNEKTKDNNELNEKIKELETKVLILNNENIVIKDLLFTLLYKTHHAIIQIKEKKDFADKFVLDLFTFMYNETENKSPDSIKKYLQFISFEKKN